MSVVFLDLVTIGVVLLIVTFVLSLVMIFIWRTNKTYAGFEHWTFANIMLSAGFSFLSLRGLVPDFYSVFLGNLLCLGSVLLSFKGSRKFLGLDECRRFSFVVVILQILSLIYFIYVNDSLNGRIVTSSALLAAVSGYAAVSFLRNYSETTPVYKFAASVNALFTLVVIARLSYTYFFAHIEQFYTPDWAQSLFHLAFLVFAIVWTFGYMILNNERLRNDLQSAQKELEKIAATDFLTGINNNRRFYEIGENEIQRAKRFRYPLSLIMFDLDFFKQINDTEGHAAGDIVLVKVIEICRRKLRTIDVFGRLGGEEFAILLPHTDLEGGKIAAEHLRRAIEETEIELNPQVAVKITASFGITQLRSSDEEIQVLLNHADAALYKAKRAGRNRTVSDESTNVPNVSTFA
jgi:diguanylate cyclase (GGDEF)-like protein